MKDIKFSVVSTVFNEIEKLATTIRNIESQTLLPDEIIIVDAGSLDGTWQKLIEWSQKSSLKIKVFQIEKCNVAQGRNYAIKQSKNDLIVSTDFGCVHKPAWLQSIVNPFALDGKLEVVGGAYGVDESEIITLPAKAEYIQQNGYDIKLDETFTVTSRSIAYKKYVWEKLGGYPEWLTLASDDSTFWKRIRRLGFNYKIISEVNVLWHRHTTLLGFVKENYRYGLGDGESKTNFRNMKSHIIETVLRYSFFLSIILLFFLNPAILLPVALISILGLRSYWRIVKNWSRLRSSKYDLKVLLYSLYMVERLRWAYLKGYFTGLLHQSDEQKLNSRELVNELGKYVG